VILKSLLLSICLYATCYRTVISSRDVHSFHLQLCIYKSKTQKQL